MPLQRVLVVGAGIAGLTLTAFLRRRGITVDVLERTASWAPVGAGIVLAINAMSVLRRLDLEEALCAVGFEVRRARITDDRGRSLAETDLGALRERHGPSVALHRAALHEVLLEAAGDESIQLATTVADLRQHQGGVDVELSNGERARYDLVVGCDGLRSAVRGLVFGERTPRYAGYTCWRLVIPEDLGITEVVEMWGSGRRFGVVPLGPRGVYCFSTLNASAGDPELARLDLAGFRALFDGFAPPVPGILAVLERSDGLIHNDLEDLSIESWVSGRVVLLGDAAHAVTPNMGQGAALAIEDAFVLDRALAAHGDVTSALADYEHQRRPRVRKIRDQSRRIGALAQWRQPVARWVRDRVLSWVPDRFAVDALERQLSKPL